MLRGRGARLVSGMVAVATLMILAAGCGGAEPDPEQTASPTATRPVPDLPPGLLSVCTQVLNDRDQVVDLEAARSSEDVYTAVFADEVPSTAELSRWRRTIEAGIAQTTAELEVLRAASTDPAWAAVLIPLEESLATQACGSSSRTPRGRSLMTRTSSARSTWRPTSTPRWPAWA